MRFVRDDQLEPIFSMLGDRFFPYRLLCWNRHLSDQPVISSRPETAGVNSVTNVSYRLTAAGERMLDVGFRNPTEVPPMHVGGCQLYSTTTSWIRRESGDEWWIDSLQQSQ
ncbi:MAG: hypothetical protein AAF517_14600 [Planctomycetota bacterium]